MKLFEQIQSQRWLPLTLAALAGVFFLVFSFHLTHQMVVTMDEGSYLLKGKWLLDGSHNQFDESKPVLNKMPLSFVAHGLSQILFEPGIRAGRYFSIFQGLLTLIGLWLAARKISNWWWAAAVAWLFVINESWLMFYARPMSQVTTMLFLAWSLYFLLGDAKNKTHAMLGLLFACFVVLTRQNMVTFLAVSFFYVVWMHGLKESLKIVIPVAGVFVIVHILMWPDIYLSNWAGYAPKIVSNLLIDPSLFVNRGTPTVSSSFNTMAIVQAIFGGFRYSIIPIVPLIFSLYLLPFGAWKNSQDYKWVIFLTGNFLVLVALHLYGVLENNLILYSFSGYMAFFAPLGLLLLPLVATHLNVRLGWLATALMALTLLALSTGIGLHLHREISGPILSFPVPRIRNMRFESGSAELWRVMLNRFGWEYPSQELIFTALAGFIAGIFLLLMAVLLWWVFHERIRQGFGWFTAVVFFSASLLLTISDWSGGQKVVFTCDQDSIQSFEQAGQVLAGTIPPGSYIFWDTHTDPSPAILLYLDDYKIQPVLLNGRFYHREGIDVETALRANVWNDDLGRQWMQEADYLLLSNDAVEYWQAELQSGQFERLPSTPPVYACFPNSVLNIYQNTGK